MAKKIKRQVRTEEFEFDDMISWGDLKERVEDILKETQKNDNPIIHSIKIGLQWHGYEDANPAVFIE